MAVLRKPPIQISISKWEWKKWFESLHKYISNISFSLTWEYSTTSSTLTVGTRYLVTASSLTLTLPTGSLVDQDWVTIANGANSITGLVVARGGSETIMGLAENMTVDTNNFSFTLVYNASSTDWRIV